MREYLTLKGDIGIYLLLLITVMGWGLSWPLGSIVVHALPPLFAAFLRYTIALPFFILAAKILERNDKPKNVNLRSKKLHLKFAGLGLLQVTLYNLFFLSGLQYTSSSDATLIIATNPTITAIFAAIIHKDENLSRNKIGGLITALAGVTIIVIQSPNYDVENRILGDIIIFMAAITWALFTTLSRPLLRQIKSTMHFTAIITSYGWLFLGISTLIVDFDYFSLQTIINIDINVIYSLLFLALVAAVFGNIAFNKGVQIIGSSKSAIFVNLVPIFGIFFSIILLGDNFSYWYLLSLILIILGVYIVNRNNNK